MLKNIYFLKKDNSAFTMIELLVVIAVLGILASIALPRMSGVIERAKFASDQAAARNLNSVTSVYRSSISSDPFSDQSNTNQSLLQILADNDYISDDFEPQSENIEFAWLFAEERWSLSFEDKFYVVSANDGLEIHNNGMLGAWSGNDHIYSGIGENIFIPFSINDTTLENIGRYAFYNVGLNNLEFEEGSQIKKIHTDAFHNNNLSTINLPDSIQEIDMRSFRNNNLTEIHLPASLNKIEQGAFEGNELNKITIDSSEVDIGEDAFGANTEQFKNAYADNGAGTYIWDGENWIKQ
ncbi:leucine-rich repeat protein [Halanaerobium hydrogeniformans]|uniref:Uncharacterized protein n=1 Tax=Halanaerobium hydrogeniformans TaxID=656519 RepID=E4RPN0_HALHG|nr:leucine-rich repeat protein [Halanaerobium hydrogeniformans]ADQ13914.1 hypothetical protein Halsa_0440 [Halanaerobium hydrogeniformans]